MSFTVFEAELTRTELGLPPLNLNDHATYRVAAEIMGGTQAWQRQSVRSPYVDGEFTVNRSRSRVEERFGVQVLAPSQSQMQAAIAELIEAITQFRFQLWLRLEDASYAWQCETADYTIDWSQARMMARQALVTMLIPRSPKLVNGGW